MIKDERIIRDLVERWHQAISAGDIEGVIEVMTEDVILIAPDRPPLKGRRKLQRGLRDLFKSHNFRSRVTIEEIEVSGNLAICRTRVKIRTKRLSDGTTESRVGHALSIFRKQSDGLWKLAHSCRNMLDQDPI